MNATALNMANVGYTERLQEGHKLISGKVVMARHDKSELNFHLISLISTSSDAISCEERGETDGDLVVALYTMGKTELLKAVAAAPPNAIDLSRRREIAGTVKMANERITSILNR